MRSSIIRLVVLGAMMAALPVTGYAQEATVSGTVSDATGGVLPGATVTAVHEASGNTFLAVADERGGFRIPVRAGVYRMTVELPGFTTVTRSGLEVLVGQQAVVNLQLSPATVQESVTVTGEAPLLDVAQSSIGSNIDPRQMSELPVLGRNWMALTLLAPGSRSNDVGSTPVDTRGATGNFQLNLDGQQVTQIHAYGQGQPQLSRDSIAEFEFIANRFDATQGRSTGVQVNAITKSGTNTPSGSVSGYFRHDTLNAADFVARRVLPYSNQQLSATLGGPIRRDKLHLFGHYEYEREPQTWTYTTPYPSFNIDQSSTRRQQMGGARLDFQLSPKTRFMVRANRSSNSQLDPTRAGSSIAHPSQAQRIGQGVKQVFGTLTQVPTNRAVNEIRVGYAQINWFFMPLAHWPDSPSGWGIGAPLINFRGFSLGQTHVNNPQTNDQFSYSFRDDFTSSYNKGGRHDVKVGGEYLYTVTDVYFCNQCQGIFDAQGGPIPSNLEQLFPSPMDVTTWNLAPLSPIVRSYRIGVGNFDTHNPRHVSAFWLQDDWAISRRLTLNLGARYDVGIGYWGNRYAIPPFLEAGRPDDLNNIAPRVGFAFSVNDRTVLRGGYGKFFAEVSNQPAVWTAAWSQQAHPQVFNDGRPDFASNPFNGPAPTFEQVVASGFRRSIGSQLINADAQVPYSHQASVGVQRQLGSTMAFQADYLYSGERHWIISRPNWNLKYNPATGANYPITDLRNLPYPDWGLVNRTLTEGWGNSHALSTGFTKRMSQRWQASGTYLLSAMWDAASSPVGDHDRSLNFEIARDLYDYYELAATDQRHRAVFNGIWDAGHGFQLSGLYFFGSGYRFNTTYGGDPRGTGATGGRLRPDGSIVPRTNFVGDPLHRVDVRVQRRFLFGGRAGVDGIVEVFNVLNHANYGSYTTVESNSMYGQPTSNTGIAYQPRMLQLGFRATF
jgi:carboxypeptidase family protein/TonB-dependent receptor-like protein